MKSKSSNSPHLKPFSLATVFRADEGIEDKIEMAMGNWKMHFDTDELWTFRDRMACPPKGECELAFTTAEEKAVYGWLFCRPEIKGKNRNRLVIRSQKLRGHAKRYYGPPLCGGYAQIQREAGRNKFRGWMMKMNLSLNLQRYMRHQPRHHDARLAATEKPKARIRARKDERDVYEDECSFDGEDNWIPNTKPWRDFANPAQARLHLRRYVKAIADCFERHAQRAASLATGEDSPSAVYRENPAHALRMVETAWEFSSKDPIGDVHELDWRLGGLKRKHQARGNSYIKTRNADSVSIQVPLVESVHLRVYAKTNKRIRFEVIQHGLGKQWAQLLREAGGEPGKWDAPRSLDDFMLVMGAVRARAAKHLNKAMGQLRKGREDGLESRPLIDLLAEIAAAVPCGLSDDERAITSRTLLYLLAHQRGYRGRVDAGRFAGALVTLKKRGVIQWDKNRQQYVLDSRFTLACDAFAKVSKKSFLAMFGSNSDSRTFTKHGKHHIRDRSLGALPAPRIKGGRARGSRR